MLYKQLLAFIHPAVAQSVAEEIFQQERVLQAMAGDFDGSQNLLGELVLLHLVHELSRQFGIEAIDIAEHAPDKDIHRRAEGLQIFLNDISHSGLIGGM